MEWGKLYANLPDDPRVQAVEDSAGAAWLLVESMCYCTSAETDGFIPRTQVERFGGGPRKKQKVAALVREELWIPVPDGYLLDPRLWNEERNLNDQVERKRKADRERIAAKREKDRATGKAGVLAAQSRDSSATCRATDDGDSRPLEKSREEETSTAGLVSHLQVPDARAVKPDDDEELIEVVVAEVRKREGRDVDRETARKVVARALRRRKDGPPASRVKWLRSVLANETDLYAELLLEPAPPKADVLDGFGRAPAPGRHAYDEDPGTGLCRCGLPGENQSYHLEAV